MTAQIDDIVERIESEEEDLDEGVPVYMIRSYPSDPELETLHNRWRRGEIVIPTFQRGFVWNVSQASRLIESFLMGLPVPGIFVFVRESTDGQDGPQQLVIDGQQRLLSVFGFFEGALPDGRPFKLTGVDERWEGLTYRELSQAEQSTLLHSVLRVVNIEQREPDYGDASIYQIFERLNTGGTSLTPQEIRNSSYHGPFNDMLIAANRHPVWRTVFGTESPDARMRDVELIVRFMALNEDLKSYTKPMRQFISDFMAKHKNDTNPTTLEHTFTDCVAQIAQALGPRPFHIRRGINVAVCDAVMVAFAQSRSLPSDISERYEKLKKHPNFIAATSGGTTDVNNVHERIQLAKKILFES